MMCARLAMLSCLLLAGLACSPRALDSCDITQRACQESIYYRMINLRGDGYDPFGGLPPIGVITEDEFRTMLEREAAAQVDVGPNPWDNALELLHFTSSPAGGGSDSTIDDEVAHVYAFYDPQAKSITVISHPNQTEEYAREWAMVTLAHELVHALQDRELDLARQSFSDSDQSLAYNAVIEGDARFYEYLFTEDVVRMIGRLPRDAVDMPDAELAYAYEHFDELGSPLFAARYLLYPLGAKYEAAAYRSGGNAAVRHAYAHAPTRTVGLLVGPDGHSPPIGVGSVCPAPTALDLPPSAAGGAGLTDADQVGAVLFYTFLRGWGVGHDIAFATAQTCVGDSIRVQANADVSATAVAWRLEFSADPPLSIARTLSTSGQLTVQTGAKTLEITATDATPPLTWQASPGCQ
jgi:hypothetical protein